ncbi:MAG: hypothetical protein Q7N50_03680 [Armatimonadota bacterium]|nr:hypothetical protein [Armatimonadota bacterium]
MDEQYVNQLELVVKQMLRPLRGLPFHLVIESLSGQKVIPFDISNPDDGQLLELLRKVAQAAGQSVNRNPIVRSRPNEVGNDIEPFVKQALRDLGHRAETPTCTSGQKKSTGYPDIETQDAVGRTCYIECKTYNIENVATTQRSFYLSPSEECKITHDGHHFVLSYEIFMDGRRGENNIYKCRHWKLLDLHGLLVDVKYEFNSDNARLYAGNLFLAEGDIQEA